MQRTIVQIARIRLVDVRVGDIVTSKPDGEHGWFMVEVLRQLPSGDLVVTGDQHRMNIKAALWDLVGIQVTKSVDVPSRIGPDAPTEVDLALPHDNTQRAPEGVPVTNTSR